MPANTTRGLPYPLPTEPVAEGAQAIRNLAEALDAKVGEWLIQTTTLGAAGQINFAAIPATFTHLKLVVHARGNQNGTAGLDSLVARLNGSSSAYYWQNIQATAGVVAGDYASSDTFARLGIMPDASTAFFGACEVTFPRYRTAGSNPWIGKSYAPIGGSSGRTAIYGGLWYPGGPLTSLTLYANTSPYNLLPGSVASLYGLT